MNKQPAKAAAPRLSVVIPCYNEAASLDVLHDRVTRACQAAVGDDYELVLVNDGSRDATWEIMTRLVAEDPRLFSVDLARNHGHQLALTAGLSLCRGKIILVLDADLQDPPELLSPMLQTMEREGADVVYGQRRSRAGETVAKTWTASLFYRLLDRLTDIDIPRDTGDFRLMTRRVVDVFLDMPEAQRFVRGMVAWIGMKQVAFPYDRDARYAGESNYPFVKMMRLTFDAVTSFSTVPLRLATWLGLMFGGLSLILFGYGFVRWLEGRTTEGWFSLLTVMLVIGSAQLLVLGLIGEYLGRLYVETKRRPLFIVRRVISSADSAADAKVGDQRRASGA